jgi:hypothetical protein
MERETGIEPATFSLGSGVGSILSGTYPVFFEIHEPIEPAICRVGKNLDQIWTKVIWPMAESRQFSRRPSINLTRCFFQVRAHKMRRGKHHD